MCGLDPLLDDGVEMATRLKSINQPVQLTVLDKLPHGFLCLAASDEVQHGQKIAIQVIKKEMVC